MNTIFAIDVFLVNVWGTWHFFPKQAIWRDAPSRARIRDINYEFPVIGDWIYRRNAQGTLKKFHFVGTYQ